MMMFKKKIFACVTTLIFCSTLKATELSYSNFEIHYGNNDGSEAWGFGISDELNENIFLHVSSSKSKSDTADLDSISFGIGFHSPLNRETDFVVSTRYIEIEDDLQSTYKFKTYGYDLKVGVRFMESDDLEVNAGIVHSNFGGFSKVFTFGAALNLTDSLALIINSGIELNRDRDIDFSVGVRISN